MKRLYLFDFDGTLTKKDTLFDFLKKTQKNYYLIFILFIPLFILTKIKILNGGKVKAKFISFFLKGKTKQQLRKYADEYLIKSNNLIHEKALIYLKEIKNYPDKYLVSASLDIWLEPFAEHFNFKLICTKAKYKNGIFIGKYDGKNCNFLEKARRIKEVINLSDYDEIFAFGDTEGDKAMLELANYPNYKYFN